MNGLEEIARWISENEALFSGMAAIVALVAIVPAVVRSLLRRRSPSASADTPSGIDTRRPNALPRLAVLPIEAPESEPDLVTTGEQLTEDLTTLLARSGGTEVISMRSSRAFALSGGSLRDAAQTLDVQYVIEGRIFRAPDGPRVTASLSDTSNDRVLWSDSFAADDSHAVEVSRQMAERVASHLGVELVRAEVVHSRRRRQSRAARDYLLKSQGVLFEEGHHRDSYAKAIGLLEKAIAKEPEYADAHGHLALLLALGNVFGFFRDSEAERERVLRTARRALELDDRSSEVLGAVGCAYCDLGQHGQGIPLLERAVGLNPSNAQAKAALGTGLIGIGRTEEGLAALEDALRITPAYKGIAPWATVLAGGYLRLDRRAEARESIDQALRCDPSFYPAQLFAALIAMREGDEAGILRHTQEALQLKNDLDASTLSTLLSPQGATLLAPWLERATSH